jgi:hypothetical protein
MNIGASCWHLSFATKKCKFKATTKTGIAPSVVADLNACKRREYSTITSIKI